MIKRNCICCEKSIGSALYNPEEDTLDGPPDDATVWSTNGNFGSTVFDPIDSKLRLELFVCDQCLREKSHMVYAAKTINKPTTVYEPSEEYLFGNR